MEQFLKIGLIVKPQGVKGELKVQPLTDDITRFNKLKEVIIEDKTYKVEKVTIGGGTVFISLSGITDRNSSELFRGKFLLVSRENAIPLEEGRYFISDIIGCDVVTERGTAVGKVVDIFSSRTDIFTLKTTDARTLRFPFLKDLIVSVDIEKQLITLNEKRLAEVSVYEN